MSKYNSSSSASLRLPTLTEVRTSREGKQTEFEGVLAPLGWSVTGRATNNKFVEVVGDRGSALVADYGNAQWGVFQVECGSESAVERVVRVLRAEGIDAFPARGGGRTRAAVNRLSELDAALRVLIGSPKGEKAEEVKAPAEAPIASIKDLSLAMAMAQVDEEVDAVNLSPREEAEAQIKRARPDASEAYIAKVLAIMGL